MNDKEDGGFGEKLDLGAFTAGLKRAARSLVANPRTCAEAVAHADYWAHVYGEGREVYLVYGPDRYGRSDVFYVRPVADQEMEELVTARLACRVYSAFPPTKEGPKGPERKG